MRFGRWNEKGQHRWEPLKTVARELARYRVHLVGVQEIKCDKGGTEWAEDYTFFCGNENHQLGWGFFTHHRIILTVQWVEFVSHRMSYIILRGCWCDTTALGVQTPTQDESDKLKDSFCQKLQQVIDHFPTYHTKIMLNFHAKLQTEDIFKPTTGNERLQESSTDNVVISHSATSKDVVIKNAMFPYWSIINTTGSLLMGRITSQLITFW